MGSGRKEPQGTGHAGAGRSRGHNDKVWEVEEKALKERAMLAQDEVDFFQISSSWDYWYLIVSKCIPN